MQHIQSQQDWTTLPSGVAVSADYLRREGEVLTLAGVSDPDFVDAFNRAAKGYDIQSLSEDDFPMDRLARYVALRSRRDGDSSYLPSSDEFVKTALEAASGKGKEPHQSAYRVLTTAPYWLATRDVLEFHELLTSGPDAGTYIADLHRYSTDDGLLALAAERILVAGRSGWTKTLGRNGLPLDISDEPVRINGIEYPVEDPDATGFSYLGNPPKEGERRLARRNPYPAWRGARLLGADLGGGRDSSGERVAALRFRREPLQKVA